MTNPLTWYDVLSLTWSGCAGANVPTYPDGQRILCGNFSCCTVARVKRGSEFACADCAPEILADDESSSGPDFELWTGTEWQPWRNLHPSTSKAMCVRPFIRAIGGLKDRYDGRSFILGKARRYGKGGLRLWECDVRMPDDPVLGPWWSRCVLMTDAEVFVERQERAS